MAKMTEIELKAILQGERQDALSSSTGSELSSQRQKALDYYQGDMSQDMPTIAGRSPAISTDVSDTIEGLMPQLLEIFEGTDDVVRFEPVSEEDVEAAQQETDTVSYVYRQQNNGFLVSYQIIKDALLSKTGIAKVWWEKRENVAEETYYDQPEEVYGIIASDDRFEIIEHTAHPDGTHDFTIGHTKDESQCCVEAVPPEELGISRHAKVDLQSAPYLFHEPSDGMSERELIELGYDEEQVKELPTFTTVSDQRSSEQRARDTVLDTGFAQADTTNKPNRRVRITEHYTWLDYNGDGKARRYKIVTGGEDSTVLKMDGKLAIEEVEWWPFAAGSPIIQTHRFFGRSVADIVMDIQRIKTALTRGLLDNINFAINPRPEVAEETSTPETLGDIMTWRPGAPIRVKTPGTVVWQQPMDITGTVYPALQYFDATREWRTGVTKQGQGIDANALQNQTATAANNLMMVTQARMRLIARILAETLFTDLMWLIHSTVRKYGEQAMTVRLRNQWVPVNPREWKERKDMTINVGLGRGSKAEEALVMQTIIGMQAAAAQNGVLPITPKEFFHSAQDYCRINKLIDVDRYFPDPGEDAQMPPPQPDPAMVKVQADVQVKQMEMQHKGQELQMKAQLDERQMMMKAEIEKIQAQADIATQERKTQAEMALAQQKFELERELKIIEMQMKQHQMNQDMQMKQQQHELDVEKSGLDMETSGQKAAMDLTVKAADHKMKADAQKQEAKKEAPISSAMKKMAEAQAKHGEQIAALKEAVEADREIEVVRDPKTNKAKGAVSRRKKG